jgi:hypothetical protein
MVETADYCLCKVVGVRKSLEKEKEENVTKKVSKRGRKKTDNEKKESKE